MLPFAGGDYVICPNSSIQADVPHPSEITHQIKLLASPAQLLQLLQQHPDALNHIHVSALYTQLRSICNRQPAQLHAEETQLLLQALQQQLRRVQQNCSGRELSNIIWTSGSLGQAAVTEVLLSILLQHHLQDTSSKGVVLTLLGLEQAGVHLQQQQAQQLLSVLAQNELYVHLDDIGSSLRVIAAMGLQTDPQQLQELSNMIVAKLTVHDSIGLLRSGGQHFQAVVNTLWAVATMQQLHELPQEHLQLLLRVAAAGVGNGSPAVAAKLGAVLAAVEGLQGSTDIEMDATGPEDSHVSHTGAAS
jgi:hypothetical protein